MAEKQDAQMETSTEETRGSADAVSEKSQGDSSSETAPSASSDNMAWVGALKKDARKKGYDEGYQRGQEELRQMLEAQQNAVPQQPQRPEVPQENSQQNSTNVTPEMVANMTQQAQLSNKFGQIAQLGTIKYPDYQEKVQAYVEKAQEKAQQGDQDLAALMTLAASVGNEDLVHRVATDENFVNEILESNPKLWSSKLLKSNLSSPSPSMHTTGQPTIKVAAPPAGQLPTTSSYGDLGKMSSAEKRLLQKRRLRGS